MTIDDEFRDEPLDETLAALAREYHEPPPVPREAMWQAIRDGRDGQEGQEGRVLWFRRAVRVALPIAAVLAVGIMIGRMSRTETPAPAALATSGDSSAPSTSSSSNEVFRVAAEKHFAQAESFLTLFRVSVHQGRDESMAPATARELLVSNRLLLDSPAAQDPKIRNLLQDIELVLAQIAQLPAEGRNADASLITDGLDAGGILTRIRSVVTTGPSAAVPQGAL